MITARTIGLLTLPLANSFRSPTVSRPIPRALSSMASSKLDQADTRIASKELLELFNHQVTNELTASQLYLSASIWCEKEDLVGMASYMRDESGEERGHAMSFIDFANKRDFGIQLEALGAPKANWASAEDLWEDLLSAEIENTQALLKLGDAAADCGEHAVSAFLQPFHMVSWLQELI